MRHLLLFVCALLSVMGVWAQSSYQSMVVRASTGHTYTFPIASIDSVSFSTEPSVQRCQWYQSIENPGIADYLREFEYDASDYSYHRLFDYRGEPYLDARQDWPYGVTLGDTTYYNLIPGRAYQLTKVTTGNRQTLTVYPTGQLRMIRAEGIDNVRDLGGWPTADGHRLRYGLLYRGSELNTLLDPSHRTLISAHSVTSADIRSLRQDLGILAELDLRGETENPLPEHSALGTDIVYANLPIDYTDISRPDNQRQIVACLHFIVEQLKQGHPVYMHCVWGADRTGALCLLLEGLLGVSSSNLDKDYELTSFTGNTRYRNNANYLRAFDAVRSMPGKTLQEQFQAWWRNAGAEEADLTAFCSLMKE